MSKLILSPEDFVNLHGHSTYSVGDAIGHADEIVSSVIENGMNSVAITDHGNMNVVADFYLHVKSKYWDKGIDFKPIFGNEFYFHPSLNEWSQHKELHENRKNLTEEEMKEKQAEIIANSLLGTVADLDPDEDDGGAGAVVENEEESKKSKDWSPIKRKHHLVLLAQNETGLKNLFRLNAYAQTKGFYMKPRIDFEALERWNEGLVCTSACLAGIFNYELRKGTDMGLSDNQIMSVFENIADRFDQIFNKYKSMPPRFYLEIQFNKLEDQHRLNSFLVALHRKTGIPLVAAADYHYPKRELFRARDMIKWVTQNKKFNIEVRDDVSQLECELFPKNAQEMVDAYLNYDGNDYITMEEVKTAIQNTKFISDNLIERFEIDQGPKLPKIISGNPHSHLETMVVQRFGQFYKQGKIPENQIDRYMAQLKYELEIIRKKRFANYFITYEAICKQVKMEMLMGPGRGCLIGSTEVITSDGNKRLDQIKTGDRVYTHSGNLELVTNTFEYDVDEELLEISTFYGENEPITLTKDHVIFGEVGTSPVKESWSKSTKRSSRVWNQPSGEVNEIKAQDLKIGDYIYTPFLKRTEIKNPEWFFPESVNVLNNKPYRDSISDLHKRKMGTKNFLARLRRQASNGNYNIKSLITRNYIIEKYGSIENWAAYIDKNQYRQYKFIKSLTLNEDISWLLGKWVADGWLNRKKNSWGICFHENEKDQLQKVLNILYSLGVERADLNQYNHKSKKLIQVETNHQILFNWFDEMFINYTNSHTKYVPKFIFNSDESNIKSFVKGYQDGDGSEDETRIHFSSVSKNLLLGIQKCLLILKKPSSMLKSVRSYNHLGHKNESASYVLRTMKNFNKSNNIYIFEHGFYCRVKNISKTNKYKKVYDITVTSDSSYLTHNGAVHNSGAGSLVNWLLDITELDPIKFDLMFERFLDEHRTQVYPRMDLL